MALERTVSDVNWIEVPLPNRSEEEFADILAELPGGTPTTFAYSVASPFDDTGESLERGTEQMAEAGIDFKNGHAVVRLNSDIYADAPAGGLAEEAERILAEWALSLRASPGEQPPEPEL